MSEGFLDAGEAAFQLIGGVINWLNVVAIYRSKRAEGVNWWAFMFFASWGVWKMVYYPSLGQWLSFTAGFFIVSANFAWVGLYWYYRRRAECSGVS